MSKGIAPLILFSGLVLMTGPSFAQKPAQKAAVHALVISNIQFPKDEVVKTGDTVTWKNDDLVPHTVTAVDGSFKSPTIDAGKEWSYKITQKKTVAYKCDFHPNMRAKLVVK
jgi:plastocyanin